MPRELMFDLNEKNEPQLERDDEPGVEPALNDRLVLLLAALLRIESEMGRRRVIINGPRVIDIDILLCDGISGVFGNRRKEQDHHSPSMNEPSSDDRLPQLILPHPRLHLRRFVLAPLSEIAPGLIHPALQQSIRELLDAVNDPSALRLYRATA